MSLFDLAKRSMDETSEPSGPATASAVEDPSQIPAAPDEHIAAVPSSVAIPQSTALVRVNAKAPAGVDITAIVVPDGAYICEWNEAGRPVFRDVKSNKLVKGGGRLTGASVGRAPGLAKMIDGMVNMGGIISFLQDVAIGKLASGAKMADRIKAAEILLDRRYGKPQQHVEIKDESASEARKEARRMSTAELTEAVERFRYVLSKENVQDAELVE